MLKLLTAEGRKSIVEEICSRFHADGISGLETIGHIEKYTPLYHFRIAEPDEGDFIFITELFGDPKIEITGQDKFYSGVRKQYHGNYEGLSKIIVQGIHKGMTAPSRGRILINPGFRPDAEGKYLTDGQKSAFDNALEYINHVLRLTIPETKELDVDPETFSSTFYVI